MALLRDLLLNKFYFGVGREGCSPVTTAKKLKVTIIIHIINS